MCLSKKMFFSSNSRQAYSCVQIACVKYPSSSFFFAISLFPNPHNYKAPSFPPPQSPLWRSSAPVLSCVKRRASESRENRPDSAWREFPRWAHPTDVKNMDWPVLSEVVRPPYFILQRSAPVASATRLRLMQEDCSIMRGEQGLFLWLNPKKHAPMGLMGVGFCCVVVNCIWASSWNLQQSCQNRPGFYFGCKYNSSKAERLILDSGQERRIQTQNKVCSNDEQTWHLEVKHVARCQLIIYLMMHSRNVLSYLTFTCFICWKKRGC